jgi:benzoyl-CoA reductase/2-hydroxyglutaryl-CoA dehydratase subunit BcrC/BadD/HgdB
MTNIHKPVVGWFENYVPEEILFAAGLLPFRVVGCREAHNRYGEYLSKDFCSFTKNVTGAALNREYAFLDGIIFTNTCTVMDRMFDVWRDYIGTPFVYMLEVPKKVDALSILFFEKNLQGMIRAISGHFGVSITDEGLKQSIRSCNERRKILADLSDARAKACPPVSSAQIARIVESAAGIEKDSAYREAARLKELLESPQPQSAGKRRPRILVTGGLVPGAEIIDIVSKCGGEVVYEDLCTGTRYYEDLVAEDQEPVKALAERYSRKITSGRTDGSFEKFNRIAEKIDKFAVDGVICAWTSFCVSDIYDVTYLKKYLEKKGMPALVLEFDHNTLNPEKLSTRIEAYFELLSQRKAACCL